MLFFSYMMSLNELLEAYDQEAELIAFSALPRFKIEMYNVIDNDGTSTGIPTIAESSDGNDLVYGVMYNLTEEQFNIVMKFHSLYNVAKCPLSGDVNMQLGDDKFYAPILKSEEQTNKVDFIDIPHAVMMGAHLSMAHGLLTGGLVIPFIKPCDRLTALDQMQDHIEKIYKKQSTKEVAPKEDKKKLLM